MIFSKIINYIIEKQNQNKKYEIRALLDGTVKEINFSDNEYIKKNKQILIYSKGNFQFLVTTNKSGFIFYTVKINDKIKKGDLLAIIYKFQ